MVEGLPWRSLTAASKWNQASAKRPHESDLAKGPYTVCPDCVCYQEQGRVIVWRARGSPRRSKARPTSSEVSHEVRQPFQEPIAFSWTRHPSSLGPHPHARCASGQPGSGTPELYLTIGRRLYLVRTKSNHSWPQLLSKEQPSCSRRGWAIPCGRETESLGRRPSKLGERPRRNGAACRRSGGTLASH